MNLLYSSRLNRNQLIFTSQQIKYRLNPQHVSHCIYTKSE